MCSGTRHNDRTRSPGRMGGSMSELVRLSYRQLGERLGISPDAARVKARRWSQLGRWRLIPGNHPNDPVYVEVPQSDLRRRPERVAPEQTPSSGENKPPASEPVTAPGQDSTNILIARMVETLGDLVKQQRAELAELTRTRTTEAMARGAAEAHARALSHEVQRQRQEIERLTKAYNDSATMLAATEAREITLEALSRDLEDRMLAAQAELEHLRRSREARGRSSYRGGSAFWDRLRALFPRTE